MAAKNKAENLPEVASSPKPVQAGPGRPKNPGPPRGDHQLALAAAVDVAELARDEAEVAYGATPTVATELALASAELRVASAWAAYCRAQGIHASAIKYGDLSTKWTGRIAAIRELLAVDMIEALQNRAGREDALGGRKR